MYLFTFTILCFLLRVFAQEEEEEIPPELAATVYPDLNSTNVRGTWLWGFKGCDSTQTSNIKEAYDDFKTLANNPGVGSNIDWNSAAAVEFLGPPGFNQKQQSQIQAVFTNAATVYPGSFLNPFRLWIYVRCDDPSKKCAKDDGDDPCNPPQDPPSTTPGSKLNAYSLNKDPDDDAWPMINFCKPFFEKRSLTNAFAFGSAQPRNAKFDLNQYVNRAETMFHELLHLDNVADSVGGAPNPVVDDLTITINFHDEAGNVVLREERAYGPLRSKILARFTPSLPDDFRTGHYVQRNADNLVFFALAKYVQDKLKAYPHLPIVVDYKNALPPYKRPNPLMEYVSIDGKTVLRDRQELEPVPGCNDRLDDDSTTSLILGAPYDDNEYPISYRVQRAQWLGSLSDPPPTGQLYSPRCQSEVLSESVRSINRVETAEKIQLFCGNKAWWDVNIVPAIGFGDGSEHKALGVIDNFTVNGDADKLYLDVSWKAGCMGSSLFTIGATDSDKETYCKTRFLTILDGCDIASTEKKYGGSVVDTCLVYRLGAVAADADVPFTIFDGGPEFSCSDADASIDPNLSKACQCFYTGEPETVAFFDKPDGGCQSLTTSPASTFQDIGQPIVRRNAKRGIVSYSKRSHPRDTGSSFQLQGAQ